MSGGIDDPVLAAIVRDPEGDWLDAASTEQLLRLAPGLQEIADRPVEGGGAGIALAAVSAAVRAYKVVFDVYYLQAASMAAARHDVVAGYLQALSRQVQLLIAAGRFDEVERLSEVIAMVNEHVTQRSEGWSALAGPPPPSSEAVEERLSVAELDRLLPGWVEQASTEDLPVVAQMLERLADDLERTRQLERALRAVTEAARARRRAVALATDEQLLADGGWRPLASLLGRRSRLLRATGRLGEVARVDEEVAALHRRLNRATERRVAPPPSPAEPAPPPPPPEPAVPADDDLRERVAALRAAGDLLGARAAQQQLVASLEHADEVGAPELAAAVRDLASLCWELGEHQVARAAAERAVAIHAHSAQPVQAAAARDLTLLGSMLWQLAELPAALDALAQALAMTEQVYGADHLQVARSLAYLGTVHHDLEDFAAARATQERALTMLERRLGSDHRETLFVMHCLGKALRALGDPAGARSAQQRARAGYERALAGYQQELGPDHPRITRTLRRLGQVRRELRDLSPAPAAGMVSPR